MRDLKLDALYMFDFIEKARVGDRLRNKDIVGTFSAFLSNMEDIVCLAALPVNLVQNASLMQTALAHDGFRGGGPFGPPSRYNWLNPPGSS